MATRVLLYEYQRKKRIYELNLHHYHFHFMKIVENSFTQHANNVHKARHCRNGKF